MRSVVSFMFNLAAIYVLASLVGCALTEEQINSIANAVQAGTQAVVAPAVQVAAPGLDNSAVTGIAAAAGLGVAYIVRLILGLVSKKKAE